MFSSKTYTLSMGHWGTKPQIFTITYFFVFRLITPFYHEAFIVIA